MKAFGVYISGIAHAHGLCQWVHIAGEPGAVDCVACACEPLRKAKKPWRHILCPKCARGGR